ncbi:MAG: NAD-dependent epimerase/dehydratase family protein [Spirochaetales bacterium]|jgi:nucleoside-diphosphate-sugar epimerase|nr:NAD-dependent epimerase/dehydratase family protein [Spirochaetales bacterium]
MNVLITGGAGFLGINLIRYLQKQGITAVRSLDKADFDYPERDSIDIVHGDIRDAVFVEKAMDGIDIVVHCAAALPLYSKTDIFSTDVDGTKLLIAAALRNNVQRFIHISSTAVYGIPDHHPLFEDDAMIGVGDYGKAKIEAEEVCLTYRDRGLCVPILRPKSFVGPERLGIFALLYDWAKDGKNFPVIGSGSNRYQLLDVEDLCASIYLCATIDSEKANDTFNIGAKEFQTMKEDFQSVLDKAGFGRRIVSFPSWLVIPVLKFLEMLKLSPVYEWIYGTASKDSFVSVEKAERILGFQPQYSNRQALIRNYRWYMENLAAFEGASGVSHRVPWRSGIFSIVKSFF